ncbi:uncharacterized protein Kua isoform X4 [Dermacentor albipictus]|uniref:uncharacterized protein Kua isoform X4 n=1 Tax=Dermacentor albipictus TaxID=60249 RepID=UPI0038FC7475
MACIVSRGETYRGLASVFPATYCPGKRTQETVCIAVCLTLMGYNLFQLLLYFQASRWSTIIAAALRVQWIRRNAHPTQALVDAASHNKTSRPLQLTPTTPETGLLTEKENLGRTTRALLPPSGTYLPGGLARWEEVLLRRLRLRVALTHAVTWLWSAQYRASVSDSCLFCPAPVCEVDARRFFCTCPSLHALWQKQLLRCGRPRGRPPDADSWILGPHHGTLLDFLRESGVYLYL